MRELLGRAAPGIRRSHGMWVGTVVLLEWDAMEGHHCKGCPSSGQQSLEGLVQEERCFHVSAPGNRDGKAANVLLSQRKAAWKEILGSGVVLLGSEQERLAELDADVLCAIRWGR